MMTQDPNPQISESIEEQAQECTNTSENDQVIHKVEFAASPKAMSPLTCVPKPRPPTPHDSLVQQTEFAKICRFSWQVRDHVLRLCHLVRLYKLLVITLLQTFAVQRKPQVKDCPAETVNIVLYSMDPMHKFRPRMKIHCSQFVLRL